MKLLRAANRRFFYRHPRQILLTVLGIALGVAILTGIDLSIGSIREAFRLSLEAVVGKASHQIVGIAEPLDDALYATLRIQHGFRDIAPVVEGHAHYRDQSLRILGVDPFAGKTIYRRFEQRARSLLTPLLGEPDTGLLARITAERLGVRVGDPLPLQVAGSRHAIKIVGLIEADGDADPALEGLLLVDIATAQEVLRRIGRIDRIDVRLHDDPAEEARLRAALPHHAALQSAEGRNAATLRMTEAFATSLRGLSALALLVGMFLIYNTMSFNLLQRRPLLANLRVLGVTRGEILAELLLEAALLGLLGAALGLALALLAAQSLLHLMTRTINDVYFVLTVTQLYVSPAALARGLAIGVAVAVLAALPPALEAAWSRPAMAQRRSVLETRSRRLLPWFATGGLGLAALAIGLLTRPSAGPAATSAGVLGLALGYSLLTPALLTGLVSGTSRICAGWLSPLPRLALRGLAGGLSRTGVAAAALSLSVAMSIGTGVMIHSFRHAVAEWLERLVQADLHISLPSSPGQPSPTLPPDLAERARALPGVVRISTALRVFVDTASGRSELVVFQPADPDRPAYRFKGADGGRAWRELLGQDTLAVSEPYASRHGLRIGDTLTLRTPQGPVRLPVSGIFFDYRSDQGVILMHRPLYDRLWQSPAVSSIGLYVEPGADLARVKEAAYHLLSGDLQLVIRSNREIRASSLALFDRTFTVTQVLRLQAVAVAFIGILSALLALQAERGRELGILRALGLTPGQVRTLVLLQSGLLGLGTGLLALPLGWLLGEALVRVVNLSAFGWTMDLLLPTEVFVDALLLAVAAAVLAGVYPAWRAARMPPAAVLREE